MYQDAGTGTGMATGAPAPPQKKSGCLKWGCIGCGGLTVIILLLVVIGGSIALKKASVPLKEFMANPQAGIIKLTSFPIKMAIMDALPEETTPEEARQVMDGFVTGLVEGRIEGAQFEELARKFQLALEDKVLDPDESEELLQFMSEAAGLDHQDPYGEEAPEAEEEGWEADEPAADTGGAATEL